MVTNSYHFTPYENKQEFINSIVATWICTISGGGPIWGEVLGRSCSPSPSLTILWFVTVIWFFYSSIRNDTNTFHHTYRKTFVWPCLVLLTLSVICTTYYFGLNIVLIWCALSKLLLLTFILIWILYFCTLPLLWWGYVQGGLLILCLVERTTFIGGIIVIAFICKTQ